MEPVSASPEKDSRCWFFFFYYDSTGVDGMWYIPSKKVLLLQHPLYGPGSTVVGPGEMSAGIQLENGWYPH